MKRIMILSLLIATLATQQAMQQTEKTYFEKLPTAIKRMVLSNIETKKLKLEQELMDSEPNEKRKLIVSLLAKNVKKSSQ